MTQPSDPPIDTAAIKAVLVAVRQAADAICDRWSFEIVTAALAGETRFTAFAERTGMASRLVASRLHALETLGVLLSEPYSANPPRLDYRLTAMGRALTPVIRQMLRWEHRWRPVERLPGPTLPAPLAGAEQDGLHCRHCAALVTARDIEPRLERSQTCSLPDKRGAHRRSVVSAADRPHSAQVLGESLDIFGDKWGIEILICSFFRVRRFGDFRACTGISANILSDRLTRLAALGILAPARDGSRSPGYWLTEKGLDLYGTTVAVQAWADAWLPERTRSPVILIHRDCGKSFEIK